MQKMSTKEKTSLIRLAASLPKGSEERRAILAGLKKARVQPDPKGKFSIAVGREGRINEVGKKGLSLRQAQQAIGKADDARYEAQDEGLEYEAEGEKALKDSARALGVRSDDWEYTWWIVDESTGDAFGWSGVFEHEGRTDPGKLKGSRIR